METVFLKLLNLSLTAGWLVLAILLLRPLIKKAPRWVSCALWGLVALRLMLPFSIESALSLIPTDQPVPPSVVYQEPVEDTAPPVTNTPVVDAPVVDAPVVDTPVVDTPVVDAPVVDAPVVDAPVVDAPVVDAPVVDTPVVDTPSEPVKTPVATPTPAPAKTPVQHATTTATWVWVGGLVALLSYALYTYVELRLRLRGAVREEGNLWRSERIRTPFVLGLFRPRVYLPFGLTQEAAAYVLAHERAHIARRDHWIKPLGFLLLAVYWFNPLTWVAYTLLCRDVELACDERVIKTMAEEERRAYSTALLDCSIRRLSIAACPLAFGEVGVKERVKHVLKYKKPAIWIVAVALVACVALTLGFLTVPKTEAERAGSVFHVLETDSDVEGISLSLYSLTMREGIVYARVDTTIDKDPYRSSYAITTYPDTTSLYRQEGEEWVDCRTTPADTTVPSVRQSGSGDYDPEKVWVSHDTVSLSDFDHSKAGVYRLEQKITVSELSGTNEQMVVLTVTFEFDGADAMVNHADGSTFYPTACVYVAEGTVTDALAKEQKKAHIFGKRADQNTHQVFQIGDWRIENGQVETVEVGDLPFDTSGYETVNGRRLLDENGQDTGYRFYYADEALRNFVDGKSPLWFAYFDGDTCTAAYIMEPCGSQRDVVQFYAQLMRVEDGENTENTTTEPTTTPTTTAKPTEPTTAKPTEPTTAKPTEPTTAKPTEPTTAKPTEPEGQDGVIVTDHGFGITSKFDPATGVLTVSGEGIVSSLYPRHQNDLEEYDNITIKKVVIEEGITYIMNSFNHLIMVESIEFPSTLENIYGSFIENGCFGNKGVLLTVPANVKGIYDGSFNATRFEELIFEGPIFICGYDNPCFKYSGCKTLTIPSGSILCDAFDNCTGLREIIVESGVTFCDHQNHNFEMGSRSFSALHEWTRVYVYAPFSLGQEAATVENLRKHFWNVYLPVIIPEGGSLEDYRNTHEYNEEYIESDEELIETYNSEDRDRHFQCRLPED